MQLKRKYWLLCCAAGVVNEARGRGVPVVVLIPPTLFERTLCEYVSISFCPRARDPINVLRAHMTGGEVRLRWQLWPGDGQGFKCGLEGAKGA